jgi:tetratricopeptide (TPR) repeat protein
MDVNERAACDVHLAGCGACRETLDELRSVIATAQAEGDRDPQVDLWPAILQQIVPAESITRSAAPNAAASERTTALKFAAEGDRTLDQMDREADPADLAASQLDWAARQRDRASARSHASRQFVFTLPQLALAASLLIAVSAGVAYLAAGRAVSQPGMQEVVVQAFAESVMAPSADVERANFADAQYDEAVADLEKILVDLRDQLNPQTIMIIERNLGSIDQAIREARAALDADPANTFLNSHLAEARRKKLDLLRRATMIYSTSGD